MNGFDYQVLRLDGYAGLENVPPTANRNRNGREPLVANHTWLQMTVIIGTKYYSERKPLKE
jgi:hypothetical protein